MECAAARSGSQKATTGPGHGRLEIHISLLVFGKHGDTICQQHRPSGASLKYRATQPGARWGLAAVCAVGILFATLFFGTATWAQNEAPGPVKPNTSEKLGKKLKTETEMTLVNVTIADPYGRLVTGLEQDAFRIFEDNTEQEIVRFSSEDVPISIGVIFDMSGSMTDKIDKSRLAAVQFFRTANPQDEFFLVDFNDRAELVSSFTASVEELQNRLMFTAAKGETALFDGIYLGLSQMKGAHNTKKALLIISDGGDNHSRYTETDIRKYAREADVQIYAIGLYDVGGGPTTEEKLGPSLLAELTEMTGGRTFGVTSMGDMPNIASKISMELRNQYVVGYRPANHTHDGKWRKVKIKLRPPKGLPPLTVYARTGYYAPGH